MHLLAMPCRLMVFESRYDARLTCFTAASLSSTMPPVLAEHTECAMLSGFPAYCMRLVRSSCTSSESLCSPAECHTIDKHSAKT